MSGASQVPSLQGSPVRVALIGMGRMGQAIDALAVGRGCTVVARLDAEVMQRGVTRADLGDADVAIEFTTPHTAVANTAAVLALGCPVVLGTTGWSADRPRLDAAVQASHVPVLWSPNFSIGVQLFLSLAEEAGRRLRALSGFDLHVVETHHTAKLDAPSGTALAIADRIESGLGLAVPIASVRVGSVPGTHDIVIDGAFEQVRLTHEARDRRVFADGALTAARWLAGRRGDAIFTMQDMLMMPEERA